jgi:hypothetical protein
MDQIANVKKRYQLRMALIILNKSSTVKKRCRLIMTLIILKITE